MARTRTQRLNLLGVVSILVGIAAFVAARVPLAGYGPVPIAAVGIGIGLLAFLLSLLTGRWSSGVPVLGVLISLGALAMVGYYDGALPRWWSKIHPRQPKPVPAAVTPAPVQPGPAPSAEPRIHSIFDTDNSDSNRPNSKPPASLSPTIAPTAAPHIAAPAPTADVPAASVPPAVPAPTLAGSRAKLEAATLAVERSLATDPAYLAARAEVATADEKRKTALAENGPGSQPVLEASSQWLEAKAKLKKLVDAAAAKDSAVQAAQREMKQAEAELRAHKSGTAK